MPCIGLEHSNTDAGTSLNQPCVSTPHKIQDRHKRQVATLTSAQINALNAPTRNTLDVGAFTTTQIAGLTAATVGNLTTDQFDNGVANDISFLSTNALSGVTTADVLSLTAAEKGTPTQLAARLAAIVRRMQRAAAIRATRRAAPRRQIAIEGEQLFMKLGIRQKGLVQERPSFPSSSRKWPKSDGMIAAPAAVARNTSNAAWPRTKRPNARRSSQPRRRIICRTIVMDCGAISSGGLKNFCLDVLDTLDVAVIAEISSSSRL